MKRIVKTLAQTIYSPGYPNYAGAESSLAEVMQIGAIWLV